MALVFMTALKFRSGVKDWDTTYEVRLNCEHTVSAGRRIVDVTFIQPELKKQVTVPWSALESYVLRKSKTPYADASGTSIKAVDGGLRISDGRGFDLLVHDDQVEAIKVMSQKVFA